MACGVFIFYNDSKFANIRTHFLLIRPTPATNFTRTLEVVACYIVLDFLLLFNAN